MATDSVMGLFQDPQQYQQALLQQQMKQNYEIAQMTPEQQVTGGLRTAGYQLGQGLGGMMGAQDPAMQRQSQRRAFIQQIDMSNPESLVKAIRASSNDPELNAYLMGKYKELTSIQKEQSIITKNENFTKAEADKTQVRNLLADVETKLTNGEAVDQTTLNKARLAYAEKGQPVDRYDAASQTVIRLPGIDMTMFPNLTQAFAKTSKAGGGAGGGSTVSVMETPMSEEARRGRLSSLESSSAQLQTTLDTITQTTGLIGPKTTGWGNYLAGIPKTQAMTLADNTEQIKASVALTKLMEMKKESKTGASGLGALNMKELETIQSILGKLNPKSDNYATDLKKVEAFFVRAQKAMDEEVRLTRGKVQQQSGSPDVAPKPSAMAGRNPQLQPTADYEGKIQRNMAANKGYTREQVIANLIAAKALPADYK